MPIKPSRVLLRAVESVRLFNSTSKEDEIFLTKESGVKSALFSSLTLLTEENFLDFFFFCLPTGMNRWPQMPLLLKRKNFDTCVCYTLHLRSRCAPGSILLFSSTNWCIEMHPAAVISQIESFVSTL